MSLSFPFRDPLVVPLSFPISFPCSFTQFPKLYPKLHCFGSSRVSWICARVSIMLYTFAHFLNDVLLEIVASLNIADAFHSKCSSNVLYCVLHCELYCGLHCGRHNNSFVDSTVSSVGGSDLIVVSTACLHPLATMEPIAPTEPYYTSPQLPHCVPYWRLLL